MWNYVERWTRSFSPCWTAVTWGEPQHRDADDEQHRHFLTEEESVCVKQLLFADESMFSGSICVSGTGVAAPEKPRPLHLSFCSDTFRQFFTASHSTVLFIQQVMMTLSHSSSQSADHRMLCLSHRTTETQIGSGWSHLHGNAPWGT